MVNEKDNHCAHMCSYYTEALRIRPFGKSRTINTFWQYYAVKCGLLTQGDLDENVYG